MITDVRTHFMSTCSTGSVTAEEARAIVQRLTLDLPERDVDNAIARSVACKCSKGSLTHYFWLKS